MMHGFQQIVTEAECRDNFVVHGLPPLGDEMAVSPPNLEEEAHGFNKWQLGLGVIIDGLRKIPVVVRDSVGRRCSGTVKVCIPHDRQPVTCVDDGQSYDSTQP